MSTSTQEIPMGEVAPSWGESLTVVRRRSGRTLTEVAELVSQFAPTSVMSLQRLETLTEAPTNKRMRGVAVAAILAYGWTDLATFGLSLKDAPKAWSRRRLSLIGPPTDTETP